MATKIKVITAKDFLEVTPDGIINLATSRQLLVEIARAEQLPVDYELLIDFRHTQCELKTLEMYELAGEICQQGDTFRGKVALLVHPGADFNRAAFFEKCLRRRRFSINAFTNYEKSMRWLLRTKKMPDGHRHRTAQTNPGALPPGAKSEDQDKKLPDAEFAKQDAAA